MTTKRPLLIAALWLAAFVVALFFDRPVAERVHAYGWDDKPKWSAYQRHATETAKFPGEYVATIAVALALGFFHPWRWRAAGFVALSGAVSGINGVFKWVAGRQRPVKGIRPFDFDLFIGGLPGLFTAKNLCFPSGHACLAFATATAVGICLPRGRPLFYGIATIVAVERVFENAHYVSDAVAGAAMGVLAAYGTHYLLNRFIVRRETRGFPVQAAPPVAPARLTDD